MSKLLLRHGVVYCGGQPWNGVHEAWLRHQQFGQRGIQLAFDADLEAMLLTLDRRDRLDKAITEMATDGEYTAVVRRLGWLRGVSTLTAFGLAVEVGDWHRFTGATIGAYLGLVPTESSSGQQRSQGSITKAGNTMPAGCSSRTPGTTAATTATPAPRCGPAGTSPHPQPRRAAKPATTGCISGGRPSSTVRRRPSSRTSRLLGSWPAGAGPWRSLTTNRPQHPGAARRCRPDVAARGATRVTTMSSNALRCHARYS